MKCTSKNLLDLLNKEGKYNKKLFPQTHKIIHSITVGGERMMVYSIGHTRLFTHW